MLIPNHPDPERLSALASGDTDATTDTSLSEHLSTCVRCTSLLDELGAIRMSLAELPDLQPHRPLRLLPEVADEPATIDRLGGWARRVFAPVVAAGAALAMVGLIGTATPTFDNLASGGAPQTESREGAEDPGTMEAPGDAGVLQPTTASDASGPLRSNNDQEFGFGETDGTDAESLSIAEEPSPWPMLLFTGLALMVGAALFRWILAPRSA